jgi:hypothetical protein
MDSLEPISKFHHFIIVLLGVVKVYISICVDDVKTVQFSQRDKDKNEMEKFIPYWKFSLFCFEDLIKADRLTTGIFNRLL